MSRWHLLIAAAGALGLGASVALAQQDRPAEAEQAQVEAAAAETAEAEPRSDDEVLADSLAAHLARVEARKQTSDDLEPRIESRREFEYHPGW